MSERDATVPDSHFAAKILSQQGINPKLIKVIESACIWLSKECEKGFYIHLFMPQSDNKN